MEKEISIVDYGMGNLFSVKQACEEKGMDAKITARPEDITSADAVILPGVGAFGTAMKRLRDEGLVEVLKEVPAKGNKLVGICLGLQLLMDKSYEFGNHEGLGLIKGEVVKLKDPKLKGRRLPVPQVGWNVCKKVGTNEKSSSHSILEGVSKKAFFYFVHSFHVKPKYEDVVTSRSEYGGITFCSSIKKGNVYGVQFHPERSSENGLKVYSNIKKIIER